MGQIITSIDEAGVNELFAKAFNAMPDQGFSVARSASNAQLQLQLSLGGRLRAVDFAFGARPIDLRGSALNPPVRYGNVQLRAEAELRATLNIAGWQRSVAVPVNADAVLAGGARIGVVSDSQQHQARLELDASGIAIAFTGNRNAFIDALRSALAGIDTSPLPGHQGLPGALVNAALDLAGQAFDLVAAAAGQAATQLARTVIGNSRVAVAQPVPRRFRLSVPGGGEIDVEISRLVADVGANTLTLSASFA